MSANALWLLVFFALSQGMRELCWYLCFNVCWCLVTVGILWPFLREWESFAGCFALMSANTVWLLVFFGSFSGDERFAGCFALMSADALWLLVFFALSQGMRELCWLLCFNVCLMFVTVGILWPFLRGWESFAGCFALMSAWCLVTVGILWPCLRGWESFAGCFALMSAWCLVTVGILWLFLRGWESFADCFALMSAWCLVTVGILWLFLRG